MFIKTSTLFAFVTCPFCSLDNELMLSSLFCTNIVDFLSLNSLKPSSAIAFSSCSLSLLVYCSSRREFSLFNIIVSSCGFDVIVLDDCVDKWPTRSILVYSRSHVVCLQALLTPTTQGSIGIGIDISCVDGPRN